MRSLETNNDSTVGKESVKESIAILEAFKKGKSITSEADAKISEYIELESNEYYNDVVNSIVTTASDYLSNAEGEKRNLRKIFFRFFICILILQLISVIVFTLFDATGWFGFEMTDNMLSVFIGSVFVETLAAIGVMIAFAYASNDEVKIIELLTAVVESYQKYNINKNEKINKDN